MDTLTYLSKPPSRKRPRPSYQFPVSLLQSQSSKGSKKLIYSIQIWFRSKFTSGGKFLVRQLTIFVNNETFNHTD